MTDPDTPTYIVGSTFQGNAAGSYRADKIGAHSDSFIVNQDEVRIHSACCKGVISFIGKGGAIRVQRGNATLVDCRFIGNTARLLGGAVFVDREGAVATENVYFENSAADEHSLEGDLIYSNGLVRVKSARLQVVTASNHVSILCHSGVIWSIDIVDVHVQCPTGYRLRVTNTSVYGVQVAGLMRSYKLDQLSYFCESCPRNKYSLDFGYLNYSLRYQNDAYFTLLNNGQTPAPAYSGSYSYHDIVCHVCPYGGKCLQGITAVPNFWGYTVGSRVRFQRCQKGYCCSSADCRGYNGCTRHRTGVLCGECAANYSEAMFTADCVQDSLCVPFVGWPVMLTSGVLYFVFLLFQKNIRELMFTNMVLLQVYHYVSVCVKKRSSVTRDADTTTTTEAASAAMASATTGRIESPPPAGNGWEPTQYSDSTPALRKYHPLSNGSNEVDRPEDKNDDDDDDDDDKAEAEWNEKDGTVRKIVNTSSFEIGGGGGAGGDEMMLRIVVSPPSQPHLQHPPPQQQQEQQQPPARSSASDMGVSFLIIVFFYFQDAQLLHIKTVFASAENKNVAMFREFLSGLFKFRVEVFQFMDKFCFLEGMTPIRKLIMRVGLVPYVLVLFGILHLIYLWYRQMTLKRALPATGGGESATATTTTTRKSATPGFSINLATGFVLALLFTYQKLATTSFALLNCVTVGDRHVLFIQGTIDCYQTWQYGVMAYTGSYIVPFCLVILIGPGLLKDRLIRLSEFFVACILPPPFLVRWIWIRYRLRRAVAAAAAAAVGRRDDGDDGMAASKAAAEVGRIGAEMTVETKEVVQILQGPFKEAEMPFFGPVCGQGILLGRRLILVLLYTFVNDTLIRMLCIMLLCFVILLHHVHVLPYKDRRGNTAGSGSAAALVVVGTINLLRAGFEAAEYVPQGPNEELMKILEQVENVLMLWLPGVVMGIVLLSLAIKIAMIGCRKLASCLTGCGRLKSSDDGRPTAGAVMNSFHAENEGEAGGGGSSAGAAPENASRLPQRNSDAYQVDMITTLGDVL